MTERAKQRRWDEPVRRTPVSISRYRDALRSSREGPARLGSTVDRLRARLGRQSPKGTAVRGEEMPVFFVVGLAKSGTTWLMKTLDAHPEVLCKGEGRFFGADWKKEILKEETKNRQPSSLYNALLGSEYLRLWVERSPWSRDGDADEHLKNLTRLATNYFLTEQLKKSNKKIVGDKSPLISMHIIEEISEIHPEA